MLLYAPTKSVAYFSYLLSRTHGCFLSSTATVDATPVCFGLLRNTKAPPHVRPNRRESTINDQRLTGHKSGIVTRQKQGRTGYMFSLPVFRPWLHRGKCLDCFFRISLVGQSSQNPTW